MIESLISQCIPDSAKEAEIMLEVVHHKQDTSKQLIGHQEVMDVGSTVVLTAVTGATLYKGTKIILVSKEEGGKRATIRKKKSSVK